MECRRIDIRLVLPVFMMFIAVAGPVAAARPLLVERGQPRAEIVIPEKPTRSQRLAAAELQTYIEKISGARLKITQQLGDSTSPPIKIYIGQSRYTEELGITANGLMDGAYRILAGDDYLALIGDDTDFTPTEPWPRGYADIRDGKMQRAWDEITGAQWGYTHNQLHKHYSGPVSLFGTAKEQLVNKDGHVNLWTYDERGSYNGVCGFLRDLGVRWYMPGEIGEIVPKLDSIPLPQVDRTVRPDFPMRILNFRPGVYGHDVTMWGFRLGVRQPFGRQAAHGLHTMTDNERTLRNHPDWFALYGDKRHNDPNVGNNQLCYSNAELFREAVRFAQVQFDTYDMDVVSIMPPDGYTSICQCKLCQGKDSPELGNRGSLSNYVWDFVNRVAREVGKSHPGKMISNCAYGVYTEPPSNIEKLEPNVQVIIVGGRRPLSDERERLRQLRAAWQRKSDNPVEIFENYPFTGRGFYLPAYFPRLLGDSINETKGQSRGEDIWITMDFKENAVGYNHFLLYFTARMYWGGKEQDAGALFDEYVRKFYGPAAGEMREFFSYCEQNWRDMEQDGDKASHALKLFANAKMKAEAEAEAQADTEAKPTDSSESVYVRRIQLIDNYLNGLRNKAKQLAQKRGPVPRLRLVSGAERRGKIVIDGKLDDGLWAKIPQASVGSLRELQTGRAPTFGTRFMADWIGNDLYFAIRCDERPGEKPNVSTRKNGDQAIWYGDAVEIELATESHSYYQIVVNPAGALVELDRGAPRDQWFDWSSKAEVMTHVADDHWTVEIRIPITVDANDPLHQVVGRRPTQSLPWFVNVCRQRIRPNASEYSAFSPTGTSGFHEPMKFAHFYAGLSHQFPADPTVNDYILSRRAAAELARRRKWPEAFETFKQLSQQEKMTELQQSDALQQAAICATYLKQFQEAEELANRISIEAVASTTRMRILESQRKWLEIATKFEAEDWAQWPFWQIGEGAFERGKAYYFTKRGEKADADFRTALTYTPDKRVQLSIRTMMAHNLESHLDDSAAALAIYLKNIQGKQSIGGADEFRSVDRAAAILTKQGEADRALEIYNVIDFDKQTGFWLHQMLISKGDTLKAIGRKAEAKALYQRVIDDRSASDAHRQRAKEALELE